MQQRAPEAHEKGTDDDLERCQLLLDGARAALETLARDYAEAVAREDRVHRDVRDLQDEQKRMLAALEDAWRRAEEAEARAAAAEQQLRGYQGSRFIGAAHSYWRVRARLRG